MPLHVSNTMCSSSGGQNWTGWNANQSALNLCAGRPPTGVMIPDAA